MLPTQFKVSSRVLAALSCAILTIIGSSPARAHSARNWMPDFASCEPDTDDSREIRDGVGNLIPGVQAPRLDFCSEWNPEFIFNGHRCCSKVLRAKGSRRRRRLPAKVCTRDRFKPNFCDEMTSEQLAYSDAVTSGKIPDVLSLINQEMGRKGDQAYCTVNNGFLAWGRPIVPTFGNRIELNSPDRCTNFGTDNMTGMVEWVGRQVFKQFSDPKYSGLHLLIGDVSAPRGGCLAGRSGPKGHASHTTGQDADIGFLLPRPGRDSPKFFHTDFDPKVNWWLIKQVFKNPYACVKVIFLDKKLIRKLSKVVRGDEDWDRYKRFIRHMPAHRNHMHVRIGDGPGQPGCFPGANPEDETGEGDGSESIEGVEEAVDLEAMDFSPVNNRKAASVTRERSNVQE